MDLSLYSKLLRRMIAFGKVDNFFFFKGGKDVIKLRELSKHHRWENIFVMPGKQELQMCPGQYTVQRHLSIRKINILN